MISSILTLCFLQGAEAATWGEVDAIWAPDATGTWQRTDRSGGALLIEEGSDEVLSVGLMLEEGARIRTTQARVRIRLKRRGQVVIRPESDVVLEDGGVLQDVGEVFYSVEGAFRVQYRGIEAAVEGTQFTVGPGDDLEKVEVAVGEGRVRVASAGQSSVVSGGQMVVFSAAAPPPIAQAMAPRSLQAFRSGRKHLGLPTASVAVLGTGRIDGSDWTLGRGLRVQGRIRLAPGMRLVVETGLAGDADRFHLQESLGVETAVGPVGISVHGDLDIGEAVDCEGNTQPVSVRVGASSVLRFRVPLPHAWGLESQLRLRYEGAIVGELGLGVSYGF